MCTVCNCQRINKIQEYRKALPFVVVVKFCFGYCMCGCACTVMCLQRSENNRWDLVFSFHCGIQGVTSGHQACVAGTVNLLSHLTCLLFSETRSALQPRWPGTQCIGQPGFRLVGDFPDCASQMLRLQSCSIVPGFEIAFYIFVSGFSSRINKVSLKRRSWGPC